VRVDDVERQGFLEGVVMRIEERGQSGLVHDSQIRKIENDRARRVFDRGGERGGEGISHGHVHIAGHRDDDRVALVMYAGAEWKLHTSAPFSTVNEKIKATAARAARAAVDYRTRWSSARHGAAR